MSTLAITGTDVKLRNVVIRHLDWDPQLDASAIGVTAHDGVVTLTGFVGTYAEKLAAERAVKAIRGVRAVANDIVVRLMVDRSDDEIAHDAATALHTRQALADTVQAVVHRGHVTLTGDVEWLFQKDAAEALVRHIRGVVAVHNHIGVKARAQQRDVTRRIVRALHHHADVDARHIQVTVEGHHVTLTGTVTSWAEREAAERAAGAAPGVTQVENHLIVLPLPLAEDDVDEIC